MNLQQLRYAVEVERTGSITQAAENLFMGQPNLSKAIRELEREVGIEIFLRTPRGMELTEKGRVFLGYAKQILAQVRQMEELGQGRKPNPRRFSLAAPRCFYIPYACAAWFSQLEDDPELDLCYQETDAAGAAKALTEGRCNLAILRYPSWQEPYAQRWMKGKGFTGTLVREFAHVLLFHRNHPLAAESSIVPEQLDPYREVVYGDRSSPFGPAMPADAGAAEPGEPSPTQRRPILVYDRGSQMEVLRRDHRTFMWISSGPQALLESYDLVQRPCRVWLPFYRDVLVYNQRRLLTPLEEDFLLQLQSAVRLAQQAEQI